MSEYGSSNASTELDDETIRQLEQAIFSARNFVHPSDDLRPRTLEQARDAQRIHFWANRLTVAALGCMIFWSVAVITLRQLGKHRDKMAGPFPEEIEQRAQSYPTDNPYQTQWRTLDAFQEERRTHRHYQGRTLGTPQLNSPNVQ